MMEAAAVTVSRGAGELQCKRRKKKTANRGGKPSRPSPLSLPPSPPRLTHQSGDPDHDDGLLEEDERVLAAAGLGTPERAAKVPLHVGGG